MTARTAAVVSTPNISRHAPVPADAVISIRGVSKRYGTSDTVVVALDDVSLDIMRGDFVAIMGTSGSGKSTLMNIIGCLDVPTEGTYVLDGHDVSELDDDDQAEIRSAMIGFVFQSFNLIRRTTACRQVELPLSYAGVGRRERRERAIQALQAVGLGERIDHLPSQLSGGQQQRVAIARAIGTDPALILADEPTGALDSRSTNEVLDIFSKLHREGRSVVVITHEDEVAARAARVIRLVDGRIVSDERNVSDQRNEGHATPPAQDATSDCAPRPTAPVEAPMVQDLMLKVAAS
jgi:putative ABC transport system ATP-binding protein